MHFSNVAECFAISWLKNITTNTTKNITFRIASSSSAGIGDSSLLVPVILEVALLTADCMFEDKTGFVSF